VFSTGSESGAETKVEVFDQCRTESAWRNYLGEFYPSSTVAGISASGSGTSVSFTFKEGTNENGNIYTDNGGNTATVEFCAQVGLYYSGSLINFAEVKLTYNVDLVTTFASLTGYTVTGSEAYTDAVDQSYSFGGTLYAYFCNPSTYEELGNNGAVLHQGNTLHLCFKVPEGNFQISDVKDLMIKNAIAAEPSQNVISNSIIDTPTYAEKTCHDANNVDINICVVSFLLKAGFFDFQQMTLTGEGNVILEFGAGGGPQRQLRFRILNEKVGHVTVKAMEVSFTKQSESENPEMVKDEKAIFSNVSIPMAVAYIVAIILLFVMITIASKYFVRRKAVAQDEYILQRLKRRNDSSTHLNNTIMDMTMCMSLSHIDHPVTSSKKSLKSTMVGDDEKHLVHHDSCNSLLSGTEVIDFTSMQPAFNIADTLVDQRGGESLHDSLSSVYSDASC
jgi:hypothetical protein